jgi:hypothetical protein
VVRTRWQGRTGDGKVTRKDGRETSRRLGKKRETGGGKVQEEKEQQREGEEGREVEGR